MVNQEKKSPKGASKKSFVPAQSVVKAHIRKTNSAITSAKTAQGKIFTAVFAAYQELGNYTTEWKQYRSGIEADKSTIAKIVKIAQSEFVMSNLENLPYAFATLYQLAMKTGSAENAPNHSVLLQAEIEKGNITPSSKMTEIQALIPEGEKAKKSSPAVVSVVSFNSAKIASKDKKTLEEALAMLESIGFEIRDAAKTAASPKSSTSKTSAPESAVSVAEAA